MALDMTTALTINAKVTGQNQIDGLTKGLTGVSGASDRAAGAMGRLRGAAAGAFGALRTVLPVLGTAALVKFGKDTLDTADNFSKLSQRTGIAVPELAKFSKAADLSDVSLEKVGKGLSLLSRKMVEAKSGTASALEPFTQLGVKVTDASGKLRGSGDVLLDVARKFKEMEDGPRKAALAMELFGKSGVDLIPMLNMGDAEIKKLGTTMSQEFADKAAVFNDRLTTLQANFGELATKLMMALLPALEKIVGVIENVANVFLKLPEPVQAIIGAIGILGTAMAVLGPILTPILGLLAGLPALLAGIPALIAGWAGAVGPLVGALGTLGQILIGVFTGPAGWVALAVAAGVAIYAFRDQIFGAFQAIGDTLINAGKAFYDTFVEPVINFAKMAYEGIVDAFAGLGQALAAPFRAVADFIRGYFNGIISGIERAINGAIYAINVLVGQANRALSALRLPAIPYASTVSLPRFAQGGVVDRPTLAMVGEGGEREYIIPESKMGRAAANYMAGARGGAVIPAFANGGVVGPATVNITTGPVLQQNGQRYVTMNDLEAALNTVANSLLNNNRTAGARRFAGVR